MTSTVAIGIAATLSAMTCENLYNELDYQSRVLNHHIEYEHKEETLSTLKLTRMIFDEWTQRCPTGLTNREISEARRDLNEIEKLITLIGESK